MEQRQDLLTGEKFIPRRITQRFANNINRIRYYNNKANETRAARSTIDKPLHVNYNVLMSLLKGKKEAQFHKEYLRGKGFTFAIHTHTEKLDGKSVYALYHFLITWLDNDQVKIIKQDARRNN